MKFTVYDNHGYRKRVRNEHYDCGKCIVCKQTMWADQHHECTTAAENLFESKKQAGQTRRERAALDAYRFYSQSYHFRIREAHRMIHGMPGDAIT